MLDVGSGAYILRCMNTRFGKSLAAKFLLRMLSAVGHRWLLCLGLLVVGRIGMGLLKVYGGGLCHIGTETFTQDNNVVGVNPHVLGSAGYRDVGEAGVDEFRVHLRVHIHQYPVCGKPLGTVRSHGVAMIEMPHLRGVKS